MVEIGDCWMSGVSAMVGAGCLTPLRQKSDDELGSEPLRQSNQSSCSIQTS
jgi:hypothetical protein